MTTTLTDRYVHAATRTLPEEMRADVADELRASIADRVEAMLAGSPGLGTDEAEYAAVAELDDPVRLAAGYSGKPTHLIGPEVFGAYLRLLRTLLLVILPITAVAVALTSIAVDRSVGAVFGHTIWTTFNVGVHLCFWVTLVWVLVERGSAPGEVAKNLNARWSPDDLPEPPRATQFPIGETISSIVFLGVTIAFLIAQHFWGWFERADDSRIPILDPALWSGWLPLLIGVLVIEMGFEVAKYRARRWTPALAAVNTVINLAFALPVWFLAGRDELLNPDFVDRVHEDWSGFEAGHVNNVVIIVVVVVAAWSIVDGWRKARQHAEEGVSASADRRGSR